MLFELRQGGSCRKQIRLDRFFSVLVMKKNWMESTITNLEESETELEMSCFANFEDSGHPVFRA